MAKRIIINMDVDYWNEEMRKELMRYLIHNLKIIETDDETGEDCSEFNGIIIEPACPPPLIPIQEPDDKVYKIDDAVVLIEAGQFESGGRVSNFWGGHEINSDGTLGKEWNGYGYDYKEIKNVTIEKRVIFG